MLEMGKGSLNALPYQTDKRLAQWRKTSDNVFENFRNKFAAMTTKEDQEQQKFVFSYRAERGTRKPGRQE
jgi:hypothetical protein